MAFSNDGMRPDPPKINALNFVTAPTNKDDLISFLCMMQSNSDFILNFAQKTAPLRELTHYNFISSGNKPTRNVLKAYKILKKTCCYDILT